MKLKLTIIMAMASLLGTGFAPFWAQAGDLDDGISEATEESVAADENIGNKDVNISFIVTDALAKSKKQKSGKAPDGKKDNKSISNYDDGENENNENSIVVGAGSRVDKVTNIVIQNK